MILLQPYEVTDVASFLQASKLMLRNLFSLLRSWPLTMMLASLLQKIGVCFAKYFVNSGI